MKFEVIVHQVMPAAPVAPNLLSEVVPILPLLGTLIAGVIALKIHESNVNAARREKRHEFLMKRLEEYGQVLVEFDRLLTVEWFVRLAIEDLEFETVKKYVDLQASLAMKAKLLVGIHFPSLESANTSMIEVFKSITRVDAHETAFTQLSPRQRYLWAEGRFEAAHEHLDALLASIVTDHAELTEKEAAVGHYTIAPKPPVRRSGWTLLKVWK